MARIDLTIPSLGNKFIELSDTLPGDAYNWSWTRTPSQVKYLAIHHTAALDSQTPLDIARFHIQTNGWGGIGYHFLIGKDGTVYYVGDLSTARANVANLNDQVIGICLIGNFMAGKIPTADQLDSARKLCDFFINNFGDLVGFISWDSIKGHKELPGQSTACPGDGWLNWKQMIVSGMDERQLQERRDVIASYYRTVLGREPDQAGLSAHTNSPARLEQVLLTMVSSDEHQSLLKMGKEGQNLQNQISSMQAIIDSQKSQIENLEAQILAFKASLKEPPLVALPQKEHPDSTFTLIDVIISIYKLLFPARKVTF